MDIGKPHEQHYTSGDAEGIIELKARLHEAEKQQATKDEEMATLQEQLEKEKEKFKMLWSLNCAQLAEFNSAILDKDEQLKAKLRGAEGSTRASPTTLRGRDGERLTYDASKTPPVEIFSEEDNNTVDDWLPAMT